MGTDIHLIAEVQIEPPDEYGEGAKWALVPGPIVDCSWCKGKGSIDPADYPNGNQKWLDRVAGKPCEDCCQPIRWGSANSRYVGEPGKTKVDWYDDRNYTVFAYLADVRNGRGFAGIDTGDRVKPIADPRGLPDDLSDDAYLWFRHHGGDHTESWLEVAEILAYDWSGMQTLRGVLDLNEWRKYRLTGKVTGWSGDISGDRVEKVSHERMDELLLEHPEAAADGPDAWKARYVDDGILYCTRLEWQVPAIDAVEGFLDRMKQLLLITGERPARIVFNFDS